MVQNSTGSSASSRHRVLLRIALPALVLFTLLRGALYVRSWGELDHPWKLLLPVFATGLLYDLAFLAYLCAPLALFLVVLPEKILRSRPAAWLGHGLFAAYLYGLGFVTVAEWFFWNEFDARFNFISVDYLIYRREVTENIEQSYPLGIILPAIGIAALAYAILSRRWFRVAPGPPQSWGRRLAFAAPVLGLAALAVVALGQGPRERFENNYAKEVASDGPYQFVAAFRNNTLDYGQFYLNGDPAVLSALAKREVGKDPAEGGLFDIGRPARSAGRERTPRNIILVSVESLSADFMARFGNTEGLTPHLDDLAKESLLFTSFYATGTRTDRGLEALTLSVPPTPGRSLVKRPDNADLYALGRVLAGRGYDVAFLYGGRGVFDNMNAFFSGNGYRIVDQHSLPSDRVSFANAWGVCDEDLFQEVIREADEDAASGRPFFFHAMTTSNHRPYTYPEGRIDIPSGTGRSGAVKYTDYALGRLVEMAKSRPWFGETLIVIVADHCASSAGRVGLPVEKYHIPLFIYAPKYVPAREVDKVSSQIDVAPTLLSLLDVPYDDHFWGRDVLADDFNPRALIGNYQKLGLFESGSLVILSPGRRLEIMDDPLHSDTIRRLDPQDILAQKAMAYYQGAAYIQRHHLDRMPGREKGTAVETERTTPPPGSTENGD